MYNQLATIIDTLLLEGFTEVLGNMPYSALIIMSTVQLLYVETLTKLFYNNQKFYTCIILNLSPHCFFNRLKNYFCN